MSHLHKSYHWIRLSVQVDLQTLVGNCCKTPERASVEVSNFKGDHLPEHLIGCLWSEISLRTSSCVDRTRVVQVSSDLGRSSHKVLFYILRSYWSIASPDTLDPPLCYYPTLSILVSVPGGIRISVMVWLILLSTPGHMVLCVRFTP